VPPGSVPVPASQIDGSRLPQGYPREVFTGNGGMLLSIKAEQGGCGHVSAAAVEQTAQRVVVDLVQSPPETGQMCPMYIREVVISVGLSAPLGARTVVLEAAR
jgi:hypothetical protein